MRRLFPLFACLIGPSLCSAQTWVEVNGGKFLVAPKTISEVRASLRSRIEASFSGAHSRNWDAFLVQYRSTVVKGHRALEIHGSCDFAKSNFNAQSEFYDERIMDGGECYFLVYYLLETKRYSNVTFHGFG